MKVAELIGVLQGLNADAIVSIEDYRGVQAEAVGVIGQGLDVTIIGGSE